MPQAQAADVSRRVPLLRMHPPAQIPLAAERIERLEAIAQTDTGRGVGAIAAAARGGLNRAARSIASVHGARVAILTGCYIPQAEPPAAETDGPPGAALLGMALTALGMRVRLLTDPLCEPVVRGAVEGTSADMPIDIVSGDELSLDALAERYARAGVTHLVSVERLGPGADGHVRNLRGTDVSAYTPPLHRVLELGDWSTVGIGDGGNEIGMGSLPSDAFEHLNERERLTRCDVSSDALIVAGVSNWGAVALGLAVALLAGDAALEAALRSLTPECHDSVLTATVDAGGVDGISLVHGPSVDGLEPPIHRRVIEELRAAALGREEAA